jgi:transposase InsO family protein
VKYRFIDEHRNQWPVRLMCQLLQVSAGGYYTWRGRPASAQQQRREVLKREIEAIHQEFKDRYGSPRIHEELQARGQRCRVNTVAKLMRQHGIAAKTKRKFRCTTDSNHSLKKELVHQESYATRAEARACIFEYIEVYYNPVRRHSALGYRSPVEYEQAA